MDTTGPRGAYGRPLSRREIDALVRASIRLEEDLARLGPGSIEDLLDRTPYEPLTSTRPRAHRDRPRLRFAVPLVTVLVLTLWSHLHAPAAGADDLPARPTTYDDGSYAFLKMQPNDPDLPVGYNPCLRIPILLNPQDGPPDVLATLQEAIAVVNRVSGLHLVYAGATSLRRRSTALASGNIVVSFNSAANDAELDGHGGVGGSASYEQGLPGVMQYYVGGTVTLNSSVNSAPHAAQLVLLEHEIGHALGLAHVDGDEVMNPGSRIYEFTHYQHGDLTGLAKLGQLPCQ